MAPQELAERRRTGRDLRRALAVRAAVVPDRPARCAFADLRRREPFVVTVVAFGEQVARRDRAITEDELCRVPSALARAHVDRVERASTEQLFEEAAQAERLFPTSRRELELGLAR